MKIGIGNDHAATEMKNQIVAYLQEKGYEVVNYGTDSLESFPYPVSAKKVKGIRACVCSEPVSARLSTEHNNSNIIAFGARIVGVEMAKAIVDSWLNAKYQGGRHQTRIDMISEIEEQ